MGSTILPHQVLNPSLATGNSIHVVISAWVVLLVKSRLVKWGLTDDFAEVRPWREVDIARVCQGLHLTLGVALFEPQVVDHRDLPISSGLALFATLACGNEMCIVLPHGTGGLCTGSSQQVLEVDACLASVIGKCDPLPLKSRDTLFRNGIMQETSKWIRPSVVHDQVIKPGQISDVLALLCSLDILGSVAVLAHEPVAITLRVDHCASSIFYEAFQGLAQFFVDAEVPRQDNTLVLEDCQPFTGSCLVVCSQRWSIGASRRCSIEMLARWDGNGFVGARPQYLGVWKQIGAFVYPLAQAETVIEPRRG